MRPSDFRTNYGYHDLKVDNLMDRPEYKIIESWVRPKSKILDLGCGEGSLGQKLITKKNSHVVGIDISDKGLNIARAKGLQVQFHDLDSPLPFKDSSFDYAICNVTIQMVYRPGFVIQEMQRVAKNLIISFPNFAYWKSRLQLLLMGKMPNSSLYGYSWHNTRHIHHLSIKDFKEFIRTLNMNITNKTFFGKDSSNPTHLANFMPNFFARVAIFEIKQ